jgi:hypothetical protein
VQPQAQPVHGRQRDQDDRQARNRHEKHHSHTPANAAGRQRVPGRRACAAADARRSS